MKKKLNLDELNVNSFKTSVEALTAKGGASARCETEGTYCPTYTDNEWCWTGNTDGAFCTAPK